MPPIDEVIRQSSGIDGLTLKDIAVSVMPVEFLEKISTLPKFQQVVKNFEHRKKTCLQNLMKAEVVPLLHKGRLLSEAKLKSLSTQLKVLFVDSIQKSIVPLYHQVASNEALERFIATASVELDCTLLPSSEIEKIIPHLDLRRLHRQGRLRGLLFKFRRQLWFYAKEDAEQIAADDQKLIQRLDQKAMYKQKMAQFGENLARVNYFIWEFLYSNGLQADGATGDLANLYQLMKDHVTQIKEVQDGIMKGLYTQQPYPDLPAKAYRLLQRLLQEALTSQELQEEIERHQTLWEMPQ